MANRILKIVERFYRSAYAQHRFLRNYIGLDCTLHKFRYVESVLPNRPSPTDPNRLQMDRVRELYGPSTNLPSTYSPVSSVKILMPVYSMSKLTEETSDLGDVEAYTFDEQIEKGDYIRTQIHQKIIAFKVIEMKTVGFVKGIIYEVTLRPDIVKTVGEKVEYPSR